MFLLNPMRRWNWLLAAAVAVIGVFTAVTVVPSVADTHTAPTAAALPSTSDYPWAGLTYADGGDQWGMAYGQCVSFVAWMIYKNLGGNQRPAAIPAPGWFPSDGLAKGPVRAWW